MNKHGNTLQVNDPVRKAGSEGKTASTSGQVVGADPETETFQVRWADGHTTWEPPNALEKT